MATATKTKPTEGETETIDPKTGEGETETIDPKTGEVLTQAQGGALAAQSDYDIYAADSGGGFENTDSEDFSLPWWVILQPGSPECQDEGSDARPGMFLNRSTGELVSGAEGFDLIPCTTRHHFIEWKKKDLGGGFIAIHELDDPLVRAVRRDQPLGKYQHPDIPEHEIIETYELYQLTLDSEGNPSPGVMAFSSTHIKPYKDFMSRARSIIISLPDGRKITKLPLWAHSYRIRTQKVSRNGQTWWIPVFTFSGDGAPDSRVLPSSDLYALAKASAENVNAGNVKTAERRNTDAGDSGPEVRAKGSVDAAKAPF